MNERESIGGLTRGEGGDRPAVRGTPPRPHGPEQLTPWKLAARALPCPVCGSEPGQLCKTKDGTPSRRSNHLERYELARELCGVPIRRQLPGIPT